MLPVTIAGRRRSRCSPTGLALTDQNRRDVARLVGRLDRIPLAIELAAAQAEALGVSQLLDRLDGPAANTVTASYARHLRTRPQALVPAHSPGPDRQVDSCCKSPTEGWRTSTRGRRPAAMASSRDFHGSGSRPSHETGRLR